MNKKYNILDETTKCEIIIDEIIEEKKKALQKARFFSELKEIDTYYNELIKKIKMQYYLGCIIYS